MNLRQPRQPTRNLRIKFLQAGFPSPRAAEIGKPSFTEFLINPSSISQNTRAIRRETRVTLEERSRGNQVRPQPPFWPHQGIFPQPIPPAPESLIPTRDHNPLNKIGEPTVKHLNHLMKPAKFSTLDTASHQQKYDAQDHLLRIQASSRERAKVNPLRTISPSTSVTTFSRRLTPKRGAMEE